MSGTFYGLGLGPGDSELITVKSWRLLSTADVVCWPVGPSGAALARQIADPFMPEDAIELPLPVPFGAAPADLDAAYADAAHRIARHLSEGREVAYLCLGDPLTYGSFALLAARLAIAHRVVAIPGVSTAQAAAAALARPLAQGMDIIKVLPANADPDRLQAEIAAGDATLVFLKAGRHIGLIRRLLNEAGIRDAFAVAHLGQDGERIVALREAELRSPYFSTVIAFAGSRTA